LSQPQSFDGYYGVALASYFLNDTKKALWFIEKSLELVKKSINKGSTDVSYLTEFQDVYEKMKNNQNISL
jgi:hypothetical protein